MWRSRCLMLWGLLAACGGCVVVNPSDVRVGVLGSPSPPSAVSPQPTPRCTPYAEAWQRVIRQQDKVTKELDKRDWEELLDEAGDWVEYVQELSGYADASPDPASFRRGCDQLLRATRAVRRAARDRDPARCARALDACDPILDRFARTFPVTGPSAHDTTDKPTHRQVP